MNETVFFTSNYTLESGPKKIKFNNFRVMINSTEPKSSKLNISKVHESNRSIIECEIENENLFKNTTIMLKNCTLEAFVI